MNPRLATARMGLSLIVALITGTPAALASPSNEAKIQTVSSLSEQTTAQLAAPATAATPKTLKNQTPAGVKPLATDAGVKADKKFISPAKQDGVNDQTTFGLNASAVEIYDKNGRKVYSASGGGAAGIVWNGRNESGKTVESGAYVAKITDFQGKRHYQTIVVVK